MAYKLIGIDLDGTLLNGDSEISPANRAAIARAADAGVMIVPCTGRGWREAAPVLSGIEHLHWGVYVTGAMVAEIDTGQSVDFAVFEPHLAEALVAFLANEPEAVLVYREHNEAGHEYLVTGQGELTGNTRWWFEITGAMVHFQRQVTHADLHNALRIGVVASGRRVPELREAIRQAFGPRVLVQSFAAINRENLDESVHVLEVFPAGVNKWRGLGWIARRHGIAPHEVAAIGDEVNDLAMLAEAGCGIAMANGVDAAKQHAQYVTEPNKHDGVARAIDRLLTGEWR
jgi:hydroxymethylpyrimidine pyrophosphatase-like HAD family hydrolase